MYKTVEKAIYILNCFCNSKPELSVKEISIRTGIEKSIISKMLSTLEKHGCVEKTGHHGNYRIGYRVHFWNTYYKMQKNLLTIAMPIMEKLGNQCGEEVSLYVLEGYKRVCIARVDSTHEIAKVAPVGRYYPLYAGASGKVLLAFLSDEKQKDILENLDFERYTQNTICDRKTLADDLIKIKSNGYAISLGEREPEAFSVTSPIINLSNHAVASISIAGPIFRLNEELTKKYISLVTNAAMKISTKIGYSNNDIVSK